MMFVACDSVSEPDRVVEAQITPARTMLIEEFTGQRCTNCPDGHVAINNLLHSAALGDSIIAVGIHASTLALDPPMGLRIPEGEEYYKNFGSPALPTAILNRQTEPLQVDLWTSNINRLIIVPTPYTVRAEATLSPDGKTIDIKVGMSAGDDYSGNLQVWVTENDIIAYQLDHGKNIMSYEHNHVLRGVVNGIDGEAVSLKKDIPDYLQYTQTVEENWVPENLEIVAFLYNKEGVAQATKCHITL